MALTPSYVGTNTAGASNQTPATNVAYAKRVTVPAGSVLSAVEAYVRLTDGNSIAYRVAVWSDNGGSVDDLVRLWQPAANSVRVGAADRWLGGPIGMWFGSATPVWIGIHLFDPESATLAYETSGGTGATVAAGGVWTGETGAVGVTVTPNAADYSIRGLVIA